MTRFLLPTLYMCKEYGHENGQSVVRDTELFEILSSPDKEAGFVSDFHVVLGFEASCHSSRKLDQSVRCSCH